MVCVEESQAGRKALEMYRYRLTLAGGVYHYFKGDSASDVRRRFRSAHPSLPAIVRVKRLGLAD